MQVVAAGGRCLIQVIGPVLAALHITPEALVTFAARMPQARQFPDRYATRRRGGEASADGSHGQARRACHINSRAPKAYEAESVRVRAEVGPLLSGTETHGLRNVLLEARLVDGERAMPPCTRGPPCGPLGGP